MMMVVSLCVDGCECVLMVVSLCVDGCEFM